jgi:hypothetical protein
MAYIGNSPGVSSQRIVNTFTATAGQTTFTPSSGYTVGYVDVYLNGIKLVNGTDYTASNGSTVVFTETAAADDVVEVMAYIPRGMSDGYTKSEADTRYVNSTGDSITGNLSFGDNDKAIFGAGSDLQIYHDATAGNSYIDDTGTGWLYLRADERVIVASQSSGNVSAKFFTNAQAELAYNNNTKLSTTSTGVSVTGTVAATSFTGDGSSLSGISAYTKSSSNPATNTNGSAGDIWVNYSSGKIYICTDATTDANLWVNINDSTDAVYPNTAPTNPTNTASFPASKNQGETFTFTFSGATDSESTYGDSVVAYLVDNFSSGSLTVTTAEVSAGSAHSFTVGAIASDETLTFRVRAKDSNGVYSSGTTVSISLIAVVAMSATGGTVTTSGDYKYHTFTSSGTFTVSDLGTETPAIQYLVVAGGGGAIASRASGGGAGGYISTSAIATATSYAVTIGAGGPSGGYSNTTNGSNSSFNGSTAIGGGRGVGADSGGPYSGGSGGSGGGGCSQGGGGSGGSGTPGQGNAGGGSADAPSYYGSGGGGGAGSAGHSGTANGGGGAGGSGAQWLDGNYYAGGGGGSSNSGPVGSGGTGGGGNAGTGAGFSGTVNTGGGGGGGRSSSGGAGGSGVVIIRYQYQNF